jgi:transposase-like protein
MDCNAEDDASAYLEQLRREALELVRQGRSIPDVAASLGVSPQTLRNWRRQGERDRRERDAGAPGCVEARAGPGPSQRS